MKNIIFNRYSLLLYSCFVLIGLQLTSCEKDEMAAPVITQIRNYEASPNDTIVDAVAAGQWVVLEGHNLAGIKAAYFNGVPASINSTLLTDNYAVINIPSIQFQNVPDQGRNIIKVVSEGGIGTYEIRVTGAPYISYIRNFADAPNDTVTSSIVPNQAINIVGYNLEDALSISFQGVEADLTNIVYTDSSAIISVPGDLSASDALFANIISYSTNLGDASFGIRIIGPPVVISVSHEIPLAGEEVIVKGYNLIEVSSFTFAGETITEFEEAEDGESLKFIAPALSQSAPIVIVTPSGTFTSAYNVNDITTGLISNYEWGNFFHWTWNNGASLSVSDEANSGGWLSVYPEFANNTGMFLVLDQGILEPGTGDTDNNAFHLGDLQWLPAESINDPVTSWVLKFEFNVAADWNGASFCIVSSNDKYMVRWEPWKTSSNKTVSYTTNGWQTITIPLSEFRENDPTLGDGNGNVVPDLKTLLGDTGNSMMVMYIHNYGSSSTKTSFVAGLDNVRVVKR